MSIFFEIGKKAVAPNNPPVLEEYKSWDVDSELANTAIPKPNLNPKVERPNSLEILWDKDSLKTGLVGKKNIVNYKQLDFDYIKNTLQPIYEKHYGPGYFIRTLLPRLQPGGSIPIHKDNGESLMKCKRTHIPLITNKDVLFKVGETVKNLKVGEIWEINNGREHSVINNSNEYRIHLIVDYLPKS